MANTEHVQIVSAGSAEIEVWRRSQDPAVKLDLTDARLSKVDLRRADLRLADLRGADLRSTDLRHSKLTEADLSSADLLGADLSYANLCDSKLCDADLGMTVFNYTLLRNTVLSRSRLALAVFGRVDLRHTLGLEEVSHYGASSVGIDTLEASGGIIPDTFLRGCGIPEEFIAYKSSFVGSAIDFYSCFISYSHKDKAFARRLHDALQGRGIRCWLDEKQLLPGDNIYDQVDRGVRMWDKTLLCASKDSLTSAWVDDEIKHAFAKEKELFKRENKEVKALIPLNLDGYLFEWEHSKKKLVMERLAPDFTNWKRNSDKFDEQLEQVIKALRTDDGGRLPDPEPKL